MRLASSWTALNEKRSGGSLALSGNTAYIIALPH